MKDDNRTSHWFSNSKLKLLDIEVFYIGKIIINKLEAHLTGTTFEESDSGMKNNPDVSVVAEVVNAYAYLTVDEGKTNEEYDNMNI